MSRPAASSRPVASSRRPGPPAGALARRSLGITVFAVCCASCLVTSTPDFEPPERTPPELVAALATPDLREVIRVDETTGTVNLGAAVRSVEDAGEGVRFRLFLDYGIPNGFDLPYQDVVDGGAVTEPTGEDEVRRVSARWRPGNDLSNGCHTLTLMVSHAFDETPQGPALDCPERLDDSSQLTWFVDFCRVPPCVEQPPCAEATVACPAVADDVPSEGGGAP